MQQPLLHIQQDQHLWLSPERCVYWEEQKTLIVSDLHFGKTGHFRKSGIAVPQHLYKNDLQRLVHQLQFFQPDNLVVVGDMFHSAANLELEWFRRWRDDFADLSIQLVKGNHDILDNNWYREASLTVHEQDLQMAPFFFTHDIALHTTMPAAHYAFSGHIHPGVLVHGGGRQTLRLPCFYFGRQHAVLPAFSHFTGTYLVEPKEKESVFAIVENKILQLQ